VISALLSEELLSDSEELSPLSVGAEEVLFVISSLEPPAILLVSVDELSEPSVELDKDGGCGILDGSFAQAASVIVSAITVMSLQSFFMLYLLWVNSPYHSCGNAAHNRQRRNVAGHNGSRRDHCPIAYCNSREYRSVALEPTHTLLPSFIGA